MEILRLESYGVVNFTVSIPAGVGSNQVFSESITDLSDLSVTESTFTANAGQTVTRTLSSKYDADYNVVIINATLDIIHEETYEVVRPYVNPNTKAETASDILAYSRNEELARAIIDSVIPDGFYYKKKILETVGLGADYLPLWVDAKKLLSVYENGILVEDRQYEITKDKTAIQEKYVGEYNRDEQAKNILPTAASDSVDLIYTFRGFPKSYDYRISLEVGYKSVPSDIIRATELLVEDISCGKMDYYKRYIADYNTDQFKLKFNNRVFEGTGNLLVDKILSKYAKSITRLGVL